MLRIGIVGDFNDAFPSHHATGKSIDIAAAPLGLDVAVEWIPTSDVWHDRLAPFDALWASPGSPYRSMEGMLAGIRFARERLRPMIAT